MDPSIFYFKLEAALDSTVTDNPLFALGVVFTLLAALSKSFTGILMKKGWVISRRFRLEFEQSVLCSQFDCLCPLEVLRVRRADPGHVSRTTVVHCVVWRLWLFDAKLLRVGVEVRDADGRPVHPEFHCHLLPLRRLAFLRKNPHFLHELRHLSHDLLPLFP